MRVRAAMILVLACVATAGCERDAFTLADPAATDRPSPSEGIAPRWVLIGHVDNARDLGGTPLDAGEAVKYGALFRGPPLANLTPEGCDEVARLGVRTLIDLRVQDERELKPESECVRKAARIIEAPLPVPYDVSPTDYIADLDATDSIAAAFRLLADAEAYPTYMHCTWGRDRTGVLAAVILRALGASRADIMHEYLLSQPSVGAYPQSLEAALDEIEARGGVESYLDAAGISLDQLDAARALVREPAGTRPTRRARSDTNTF